MIDLNDLRNNPERYELACRKKNIKLDLKAFLALDEEYRALKTEVEKLRSEQNTFNKELPKLSGEGKTDKLAAMKTIAQQVKDKSTLLTDKEASFF